MASRKPTTRDGRTALLEAFTDCICFFRQFQVYVSTRSWDAGMLDGCPDAGGQCGRPRGTVHPTYLSMLVQATHTSHAARTGDSRNDGTPCHVMDMYSLLGHLQLIAAMKRPIEEQASYIQEILIFRAMPSEKAGNTAP